MGINAEDLKRIMSGLTKGYEVKTNGSPCESVSISVDEEGKYIIDLKSKCDPAI